MELNDFTGMGIYRTICRLGELACVDMVVLMSRVVLGK